MHVHSMYIKLFAQFFIGKATIQSGKKSKCCTTFDEVQFRSQIYSTLVSYLLVWLHRCEPHVRFPISICTSRV